MSVEITIEGGCLATRVRGWDRLLSLSSGPRVPLAGVLNARVMTQEQARSDASGLWKRAGAGVPGVVKAGVFGGGEQRQFWCAHSGHDVLVVDLAGQRFSRLVLQVADPRTTARAITVALPEVRLSP